MFVFFFKQKTAYEMRMSDWSSDVCASDLMQGGEAPLVFVIVHLSHKRMLTREWFYTGVTRASQRCVVLYTRDGVGNAIGKQAIKGKTLEDKIRSFQEAQKIGLAGASVNVRMPTRRSLSERSEEQSGLTSPMTVPASPQEIGRAHV